MKKEKYVPIPVVGQLVVGASEVVGAVVGQAYSSSS